VSKRGWRAGESMREGAVYKTGVKAGAVPPAWPSHHGDQEAAGLT